MEAQYSTRRSDKIEQLVAALCAAQAAFTPAVKDCSAQLKAGREPYRWASHGSMLAATRPALTSKGLIFLQTPVDSAEPGVKMIELLLAHSSGQYIAGLYRVELRPGASEHQQGSAITYAMRYSMASMLGIACSDDDCGVLAEEPAPQQPAAAKGQAISSAADAIVLAISEATSVEQASSHLPKIEQLPVAEQGPAKIALIEARKRLRGVTA